MSSLHVTAGVLLAGGEGKKSGPLGLAIILVLCVACYFLFKSMSKHLKRVREHFPADADAQGEHVSRVPAHPAVPEAVANGGAIAAQPADPPPESVEPRSVEPESVEPE